MPTTLHIWKRWLLGLLAGVLIFSLVAVDAAMISGSVVQAAPVAQNDADFRACDELDEDELRGELNGLAQQIFADDANGIDLDVIVDAQWDALGLDRVVDRQIDAAVAAVRVDEDALDTFLSGWSPDKAEALTRIVAERVFDSEEFRQAIDRLSAAVAVQIERRIAELAAESVSVNLLCLQQFIERHYADAVVTAFANDISQSTADSELVTANDLDSGIMSVIGLHKSALGGIGVIVATQITRRIAVRLGKRVSQRVAGRIASRVLGRVGTTVIPLAGWVIGAGLIAFDVIDSLDGALPQIQKSLKDEEIKALIRAEIVASVEPDLRQEMPVLAREIANDLYGEWLDFKRKYRQVLALAAENEAFDAILAASENLGHTAELVDIALSSVGRNGLDAAIDDGSFASVQALPPEGALILADTGSFATVLDWADLAGTELPVVVASELYKHQDPATLDRALLDELLATEDPALIAKLALLDPAVMGTLLDISTANLNELSRTLSADELAQLAAILDGMEQVHRNQLITAIIGDPETVTLLERPALRRYIESGRDLDAAITFLNAPGDASGYLNDLFRLATRQVTRELFVAKYGWPLTGMAFLLPIVLVLALVSMLLSFVLRPFTSLFGLIRGDRR